MKRFSAVNCDLWGFPVAYEDLKGVSLLRQVELLWMIDRLPETGVFLEIGAASGVTAAVIAASRPRMQIITLDLFLGPDETFLPPHETHRWEEIRANRQPNMALWYGTTDQLRGILKPGLFAAILVDGDHLEPAVAADLRFAAEFSAADGSIFAHDYDDPFWPGAKQAIDAFVGEEWSIVGRMDKLVELRRG